MNEILCFVEWSDEDRAWVGYCPDLFNFHFGVVSHGNTTWEAFSRMREIIKGEEILTGGNDP